MLEYWIDEELFYSWEEALDNSSTCGIKEPEEINVWKDEKFLETLFCVSVPDSSGKLRPEAYSSYSAAETAIWLAKSSYEESSGIWKPYIYRVSELEAFVAKHRKP